MPDISKLKGRPRSKRPRPPPPGLPVKLPLTPIEITAVQVGLSVRAQLLILGKLPKDAADEAIAKLSDADVKITPNELTALRFRIDPEPAVNDINPGPPPK